MAKYIWEEQLKPPGVNGIAKTKYGITFFVVDFLQLIIGQGQNKEIETTNILREFCNFKNRENVDICLISQFSQITEDRKPRLSDLKYSSSIRQLADFVILLHTPKDYRKQDITDVDVLIEKNRDGRTGEFQMMFDKESMTFKQKVNF